MPPKRKNEPAPELPRKRSNIDAGLPRRDTTAELEQELKQLELSQLKDEVQIAMKKTPRFLFRFFSSESGGNKCLNTIDAITPRAFLDQKGPDSFYTMKRKKLAEIANKHVNFNNTKGFKTVFSSWSQSLALTLSWAWTREDSDKDMHICILDTTQLQEKTVILHTQAMKDITGGKITLYTWEYLAFGIICTPAFRAVPLDVFSPSPRLAFGLGSAHSVLDAIIQKKDINHRISRIKDIARAYGGGFEVPIAAHLMAFAATTPDNRTKYCTAISSSMPIPATWAMDATIMDPDVEHYGFNEVGKANDLLREMVVMKHTALAGKMRKVKCKKEESKSEAREKAKRATASVIQAERMPLAARRAFSSMVRELDGSDETDE